MLKTKSNNFEQSPQTPKRQNISNARFLVVHRFLSVQLLATLFGNCDRGALMNQLSIVKCHISPIFCRCSKNVKPQKVIQKTTVIYRDRHGSLRALEMINTGDHPNISDAIKLSKASCIPSAPIIILLMKQRSNAAWPFRTLESDSENTDCLCK